jgi:uncharacterized membrane protein
VIQVQANIPVQTFAFLIIAIGIILIFLGFFMRISSWSDREDVRTESKGVILLGPIPIVWGYGKRGWAVAAVAAIVIFFGLLLLFS